MLKLVMATFDLAKAIVQQRKYGWRAGYRSDQAGTLTIDHGGRAVLVHEMRTQYGWPVLAMIELPLGRSWHFDLRPQAMLRLGEDIEINDAEFDAAFVLCGRSMSLARRLCEQQALRDHLLELRERLAPASATLSRVAADAGRLAIEVNVRHTPDRPRLYRALVDWLEELGRLLAADPTERAATPAEVSRRLRKARAARATRGSGS
jgi:hypothetical protein